MERVVNLKKKKEENSENERFVKGMLKRMNQEKYI